MLRFVLVLSVMIVVQSMVYGWLVMLLVGAFSGGPGGTVDPIGYWTAVLASGIANVILAAHQTVND